MSRVFLAGRLRDYESASLWRQTARFLLSDQGLSAVSPVFAPWDGEAPPALTPEAVEWPDLREFFGCRYVLVAGGAGSGTGFALGYAYARSKEPGRGWPEFLIWVMDAGPPPPFIRLWEPVCVPTVEAAVEWIVSKEREREGDGEAAGDRNQR